MATWFDIESVLDRLEDLDKATLESFARVMPPASRNPNFHRRFDQAQQRIRRQLDQIAEEEMRVSLSSQEGGNNHGDDKWYKKPVGILVLSVSAGLLVVLFKFLFGL